MSSSESMHSLAYENNNHSNNKGKNLNTRLFFTSLPSTAVTYRDQLTNINYFDSCLVLALILTNTRSKPIDVSHLVLRVVGTALL